jgi:hypothetical protein
MRRSLLCVHRFFGSGTGNGGAAFICAAHRGYNNVHMSATRCRVFASTTILQPESAPMSNRAICFFDALLIRPTIMIIVFSRRVLSPKLTRCRHFVRCCTAGADITTGTSREQEYVWLWLKLLFKHSSAWFRFLC